MQPTRKIVWNLIGNDSLCSPAAAPVCTLHQDSGGTDGPAIELEATLSRHAAHLERVRAHVGDTTSCANRATDVNLVKILIGETIRGRPPSWLHTALRLSFQINGRLDPLTAYWIRLFNADHSLRLSQQKDGIISPARGAQFAPDDTWTIVKLNWAAKQADPTRWQNLPPIQTATRP